MFKEDLKIIWDYVKNILRSRLLPLIIFSVVLFGILIYKLFNLQIIHGDEYKVNYAQKSEKTLVLNSTRGNMMSTENCLRTISLHILLLLRTAPPQ